MPAVATLATNQAIPDLRVFLQTLELWNPGTTVYLFGDKEAIDALSSIPYKGRIHYKECLSGYTALRRPTMERLPGTYGSLWAQFMAEKITLLEWALPQEPEGLFFCDSDIAFFGPLPEISGDVGLSPHRIREADEARYGRYNGGFLWIKDLAALTTWRAACGTSRFYEQAALECFDGPEWAGRVFMFPPQTNYGWWRLWQGRESPATLSAAWGIRRDPAHSGIIVEGAPLRSVHTHWGPGQPPDAAAFNSFVLGWLTKLSAAHPPAKALLRILTAATKTERTG